VTAVLEQLRLAAALVHRVSGADLEVRSGERRWIVSRSRPDAAVNPCSFRKLVLAAMRGNGEPLGHVEHVRFVGGLREIGGGVYQRAGQHGPERRVATLLSPSELDGLLRACAAEFADDVISLVERDPDLGISLITVRAGPSATPLRLDAAAHWIAASCLVEELIAFASGAATT
jgi:hypothetical protein